MYSASYNEQKHKADAEAEYRRRHKAAQQAPDDWRAWLASLFPSYVAYPFAARHEALWGWVWAIEPGVRPPPFVGIWPRGGGKSSSAELACTAVATRRTRRYGWYVSETQDQADDHVANVATQLEAAGFDRALNKYGASKGWRRSRVRTAQGFTLDALGLDTARRGAKLDEQRPDWIVIDDVDGELDTEATTEKKIATLTKKLLPAGSSDLAVLAVQNEVLENGIFARLANGSADFLSDRILSGPFKAIDNLTYRDDGMSVTITGGTPTWAGQDLVACQQYIDTWGLSAFLSECQHEHQGGKMRFLPSIGMWDMCMQPLPPLDCHTPVYLAMDAGESSDTFAVVLISRHPTQAGCVAVRYARAYVPSGPPLDFDAIERDIRALCGQFAIQQIVYDPFLLGQMIRRLQQQPCPPCEPFPQGAAREEADKQLLDLITQRRIAHDGNAQLREHMQNADKKISADGRKLRIVKRTQTLKVDMCVALAMGSARCLGTQPTKVPKQAERRANVWSNI